MCASVPCASQMQMVLMVLAFPVKCCTVPLGQPMAKVLIARVVSLLE